MVEAELSFMSISYGIIAFNLFNVIFNYSRSFYNQIIPNLTNVDFFKLIPPMWN